MWVDRLDRHPELGLVDLHVRSARRDDVSVNRGLWKGFGTDRGLSKGHAERGRARKSGNQMGTQKWQSDGNHLGLALDGRDPVLVPRGLLCLDEGDREQPAFRSVLEGVPVNEKEGGSACE